MHASYSVFREPADLPGFRSRYLEFMDSHVPNTVRYCLAHARPSFFALPSALDPHVLTHAGLAEGSGVLALAG